MIDSTRVINALKDCRMSNAMVAEGTGICQLSISKYKRGLGIPNGVNLKKLASFFQVPEAGFSVRKEMSAEEYVEIIRKKDAQIDQLIAMVTSVTGMLYANVARS